VISRRWWSRRHVIQASSSAPLRWSPRLGRNDNSGGMQRLLFEQVDDGEFSGRVCEYVDGMLPKIVENVIGGGLNSGSELEGGVNESISVRSSKCRVSKGSFESLDEWGLSAEENLTIAEELDASSFSPKSSNSSADSSESGSACFADESLPFPLFFGAGGCG
jgi:hypothetical protein